MWRYVEREKIDVVPLYLAAPRPTVERDGLILMVDDARLPLKPGEQPVERLIRFRILGCYPVTGAIESLAAAARGIIAEMTVSTSSGRQDRAIDKGREASMEAKQEGYF